MKPEQKLWQLVKAQMPGEANRVENVAGTGMPDVYGCVDGMSYWVELKVQSENTAAEDVAPLTLLRPAQRVWHIKHGKAGGVTHILVRNGQRLSLYASWGTLSVLLWQSSKPWNWDTFRQALRGPK